MHFLPFFLLCAHLQISYGQQPNIFQTNQNQQNPTQFGQWPNKNLQNEQSKNPSLSRNAFVDFVQSKDLANDHDFDSLNVDYSTVDRRKEEGWDHLYPFGEMFHDEDISDRQWKDVQIDLRFFLPFHGFRFNYTFIFPQGYIAFSNPRYIQPPYTFPTPDWPKQSDPSAIAVFMMEQQFMHIGQYRMSNMWYRVISRPISSIQSFYNRQSDTFSNSFHSSLDEAKKLGPGKVEDPALLDVITRDIQSGMVGARGFKADYALLVTWERMGYGGAPKIVDITKMKQAKTEQNTYQMMVATDEIRTYVIFNYGRVYWTSSTQAGAIDGRGGKQSAVVGFNGGNDTAWTAMPWSARGDPYKLVEYGNTNVAGRWIARIDEKVEIGGCSNDSKGTLITDKPYASMLGGFVLNVTAACFRDTDVIKMQIDELTVDCIRLDMVIARCAIPVQDIYRTGMVDIKLSADGGKTYPWTNKFYILTPSLSYQDVQLIDSPRVNTDKWHNYNAGNLTLKWPARNLTSNLNAKVDIRLFGYWENSIVATFSEVGSIAVNIPNTGSYSFIPKTMDKIGMLYNAWRSISGGVIQIRLSDDRFEDGGDGIQWSKLTSFGWYFADMWQREYGVEWAFHQCVNWFAYEGRNMNFYPQLEIDLACPCTLAQAVIDVGRFVPLSECDMSGNHDCYYHKGAKHCVMSATSAWTGAAQVCCYDYHGFLMFSHDYEYTTQNLQFGSPGVPYRAHPWGSHGHKKPPHIPSLSNFYNDLSPYDTCCKWAGHCEFYYWRRITSGCQEYRPPAVGYVYGLGHFITFDDVRYNFLGKGLFTLLHRKSGRHETQVQVRMETPTKNILNQEVAATIVTGIAARDNNSAKVEIFARKDFTHWRYTTDVYVDNHRIFFDTAHQKLQMFKGVAVRSHPLNMNMSELEVMFGTGLGLLIREARGSLNVMVSIPPSYKEMKKETRKDYYTAPNSHIKCSTHTRTMGLLGTWNEVQEDDFTTPDCQIGAKYIHHIDRQAQDTRQIFQHFGMKWRIDGRSSESLFDPDHRAINNPMSFSSLNYSPAFDPWANRSNRALLNYLAFSNEEVEASCQGSFSCKFDYMTMGRREFGLDTLQAERKFTQLKREGQQLLISCGPLERAEKAIKHPVFDNYLHGSTVKFTCQPDYFLHGDEERTCINGTWTPGWYVWCRWRGEEYALKWFAGIIVSVMIIFILTAVFCWCRSIKEQKLGVKNGQNRFSNVPKMMAVKSLNNPASSQAKNGSVFTAFEGNMQERHVPKKDPSFSSRDITIPTPSPVNKEDLGQNRRAIFFETAA